MEKCNNTPKKQNEDLVTPDCGHKSASLPPLLHRPLKSGILQNIFTNPSSSELENGKNVLVDDLHRNPQIIQHPQLDSSFNTPENSISIVKELQENSNRLPTDEKSFPYLPPLNNNSYLSNQQIIFENNLESLHIDGILASNSSVRQSIGTFYHLKPKKRSRTF